MIVLAVAGLAAQQPAPAGQRPPGQLTFRVEGNYIEVDAVVTDSRGNFIRDLKQQDFEVTEDKKPQTVDVFSLVDIPLERADRPLYRATPVEPDVATNEKELDGRLYVIVMDGNHVPANDSVIAKRVAHQFIDQNVSANDLAAVVLLQTGKADANQEFTASKAALNAAVDKFIGEKVRSKALNVLDDFIAKYVPGKEMQDVRDPAQDERAVKASATIDALRQLSTSLAGIRGRRKAIVFFSEGIDFNTDDIVGTRPGSGGGNAVGNIYADNTMTEAIHAGMIVDEMQRMYETASKANVAIYTVDPRGVGAVPDTLIQAAGMPDTVDLGPVIQASRLEYQRAAGTLRTFADATGGTAIVGTNDFAGGFRRIVEDNSAYYVLGYHAPAVKPDGKFHDITVKVNRPGVQVRARKGYYAAKNAGPETAPPDPTTALLNSPMQVSGLGIRMMTGLMKGTAPNSRVNIVVEFNGADVMPDPANGAPGDKIEVAYAAIDGSAKVIASGRKTLELPVRPETRQSIADRGLRLVTEFDIPPGRYQLRLAANEAAGGRAGSVFWNLDVPDFSKTPLVMGTLAVASTGDHMTTAFDSATLQDLMPGPPTTVREFKLEDTLAVLAEVYDNDAAHPHSVDLSAVVRSDDGTQVFSTKDERDSKDIKAERGGYTYVATIPLQDLVPGRYVLTVEAQSRLGGDPATREFQFTVK
ncbi:MAG TPA: VWA domain-containing protein [Vicinamibacterales bacterium]|nr:VWA domain-containing protein [Vicinamibacterales bacterium]